MKIIIDKDRKLVRLETDDFMLKLNGKSNAEYKAILKQLDVELVVESGAGSVEADALTSTELRLEQAKHSAASAGERILDGLDEALAHARFDEKEDG